MRLWLHSSRRRRNDEKSELISAYFEMGLKAFSVLGLLPVFTEKTLCVWFYFDD